MTYSKLKNAVLFVVMIIILCCEVPPEGGIWQQAIFTLEHGKDLSFNPRAHRLFVNNGQPAWCILVTSAKGNHLVYNGKQGKAFDYIDTGNIHLRRDGKAVIYIAETGDKKYVVKEDMEGEELEIGGFDVIHDLLVDDDCQRILVYGIDNEEYILMDNEMKINLGTEGGVFDLQMNDDGSNIFYIMVDDDIDKKFFNDYEISTIDDKTLSTVIISPAQAVAFITRADDKSGKEYVRVDDNMSRGWDNIDYNSFVFSNNDKHFAYAVYDYNHNYLIVLDNNYYDAYQFTGFMEELVFSPDGKRLGFITIEGECDSVVVDGKLIGHYEDIVGGMDMMNPGALIFSPDSLHYGFIASIQGKYSVFIDGQKASNAYDYALDLVLSADGRHYAARAVRDSVDYFILDGKDIQADIREYAFGHDKKYCAYLQVEHFFDYSLIINGKRLADYEFMCSLKFDENNNLYFLALKENDVLLCKVELNKYFAHLAF